MKLTQKYWRTNFFDFLKLKRAKYPKKFEKNEKSQILTILTQFSWNPGYLQAIKAEKTD